jgi:hypothetical protein
LAELVAIFFGINLGAKDEFSVSPDDSPGLESKPNCHRSNGQWVGAGIEEAHLLKTPAKDAQDCSEGHIHSQQTPEIAHRRDF